ncbi:HAD-IA family hydrolase [Streptomyces sp. NPDC002922]|uniref:HAD family hydrolase n=1 Tax=Streptomyces sp. NPDC002922 TaxID=3154439 RepID=UPI0033BDD2EC
MFEKAIPSYGRSVVGTELQRQLRDVECVIFDFDGPVCDLFAKHPASKIAETLMGLVKKCEGLALMSELKYTDDPMEILRALALAGPAAASFAPLIENQQTVEEQKAADGAEPTPGSVDLIRELSDSGRRLAVASNNSAQAVERYLAKRDLLQYFDGHVHGRNSDLALLKPDPDSILRALKSTGTDPGGALMIGDAPTDLDAAQAAGVEFLGYERDVVRAELLRRYGASDVVGELWEVQEAFTCHRSLANRGPFPT